VKGEFRDLAITIQQFNLNSKQINIQYLEQVILNK